MHINGSSNRAFRQFFFCQHIIRSLYEIFLHVTSDYNVVTQILSNGYRIRRLLFCDYVIKKCVLFLRWQTLFGRGLQTAEKHDIYTNAGGHRKLADTHDRHLETHRESGFQMLDGDAF